MPSGQDFQVAAINPTIAIGKVFDDGITPTLNENGISGVTRNSAGNYTVTLDSPRPDSDYIIQLTLISAGPDATIEVTNQATDQFTVEINRLSSPVGGGALISTPVDEQWYFTVIDF